ncbi:MAG TPA: hypothetical protein VGO93_14130 [Candidatus Xenobia bacterium]|jgi:hypothetical protein
MSTITAAAPAAVQYSQVGGALAAEAMRSYDGATQWPDADVFMGNGLNSILSNNDTTPDEKTIARLGWNMGNHGGMQYQNSAQARYAAASAIANHVAGSIGHVMAVVGMNAYSPANQWPDADAMTGDALLAISTNQQCTDVQRSLAKSAWDQTNVGGLQYTDSAQARYAALQQIAQQP